ncbi:IS21 family transposase [Trueperella abortisuis]|uniref:Transposase n=1 Tax=Trueperella abortisuis TaxID=445930 RepID=A0ABT9PH54_9ACTO|nr:IS21 family transposase [Trueperella abortisuis]MDP9831588.1 transposase [Trueperella abortisuis]MDP9831657.1 transposase [Trueperella abortisuis]MDP9832044.1 transposase [Trueperella abortisuis]MDP9832670.1 transposase [Trueperella abortisuis]MDP9832761.1 transposase [Trueperella abortisuis]
MTDYRLIIKLLLQGLSYRQIQQRCGAAQATIAKARKAIDSHGITSELLESLDDSAITDLIGDGRLVVADDFVGIDFDVVIKARTGRNKTPLRVLWSTYLDQPAPRGLKFYSYERFRQLVAAHVATQGVTALIVHQPGHTMQVDWAGSTMAVVDPITAKRSKIHIFVASLPYSGMVFAHGFIDEKQPSWLEGHRLAFEYFGGVTEVVVPDNASTASNQIAKGERARRVNAKYEEFLEHYNTAALPTNPVRPREKGNVESGVKIVTNWVIRKLADVVFASLDDLNDAVAGQVEAINHRRPFRNQQRSRQDIFEELESDELGNLPATGWVDTVWKKSKVTPDWHITINTVKYSVPYQLVGRSVDVRIRGQILDVFADGQAQARHQVSVQRGAYVTDVEHAPPGMAQARNLWTPSYFVTQASRIGPYTRQAVEALLASKKITAQGFQPARNIIKLGKATENKLILEQACQRLLGDEGHRQRAISYTAVKNMMAVIRHEQSTRPTAPPTRESAPATPSQPAPSSRSQSRGMLGGREQFSLSALMKEGDN